MYLHRLTDVFPLGLGSNVLVVNPAVAVAGDFPIGLHHGGDGLPGGAPWPWPRRKPSGAVPRLVNSRCSRQNPARLPYSYMDSMFRLRTPSKGCAPTLSDRKVSEAGIAVEGCNFRPLLRN